MAASGGFQARAAHKAREAAQRAWNQVFGEGKKAPSVEAIIAALVLEIETLRRGQEHHVATQPSLTFDQAGNLLTLTLRGVTYDMATIEAALGGETPVAAIQAALEARIAELERSLDVARQEAKQSARRAQHAEETQRQAANDPVVAQMWTCLTQARHLLAQLRDAKADLAPRIDMMLAQIDDIRRHYERPE